MQQEDVCELPSAKQLEQLKKQDKKKKLVNVSEDVLASINTNRGQNLADLSKSHKVMLLFLRHSKCCFCKETIVDIADNFNVLVQLNTVPVFVHMEANDVFDEFIAGFQNDKISNMLRVHDAEGKVADHFEVGDVVPLRHAISLLKRVRQVRVEKGFQNSLTAPVGASSKRLPALFIIENAKVVHEFRHITYATRPDYLAVLIDPGNEGAASDACRATDATAIQRVYAKLSTDKYKKPYTENFNPKPLFVLSESQKTGCLPAPSTANQNKMASSTESLNSEHEDEREIVLTKFLADPVCRKYFKLQASKEHSAEHILFWEEIQLKYKAISIQDDSDIEKRRELATIIIENYFNEDSVLAINTSDDLKSQVRERLKKEGPEFNLFDAVLADVETNTLRDTYLRFLRTDYYKQMKFSYKRATIL